MATLKPLMEIHVPSPKAEVVYETVLFDRRFAFKGLKRLLGAADYEKAGDRLSGLAAASDLEREAARAILSGLKLREIYESPLVGEDGRVDEVMRANYDIDEAAYNEFTEVTIGDAKNFILNSGPDEIKHFGRGLTGVMAASIAKLMDVQELIYATKKIQT